jgi:dihydrofolate reductase
MNNPTISIIAAIGENNALGKNNHLLWHIKADLVHFKKLTTGHPVIMGRKTFESIGKPLPNRTNIIVSRDPNFFSSSSCHSRESGNPESLFVFSSIEEAIEYARSFCHSHPSSCHSRESGNPESSEIFIIGGASIYAQAIKFADKLYLTLIKGTFDGDAFFPDYSEFKKEVSREEGTEGTFHFTFLELVK